MVIDGVFGVGVLIFIFKLFLVVVLMVVFLKIVMWVFFWLKFGKFLSNECILFGLKNIKIL